MNKNNEHMIINLRGNAATRQVWLNAKELNPARSQKLRNHSPDGFNWGYGGSGPAQLALAVYLELYGSSEGYQDFKFKHIAAFPMGEDFDANIEMPDAIGTVYNNTEIAPGVTISGRAIDSILNVYEWKAASLADICSALRLLQQKEQYEIINAKLDQ